MSEEYGLRGDTGELADPDGRTETTIEFDRLFALLSKARRRRALYCIAERSATTLSTSELVEELAALERRLSGEEPSREELELSLRHVHLPKLDAADVIDYEDERSAVSYRGGRRVDRWIDRAMEAELPGSAD